MLSVFKALRRYSRRRVPTSHNPRKTTFLAIAFERLFEGAVILCMALELFIQA